MKSPLPAKTRHQALKLSRQGLPYTTIAKKLGVSASWVCKIAVMNGIFRGRGPKPSSDVAAARVEAQQLRSSGLKYQQIADRLSVSRQRAFQLVRGR